MGKQMKSKIFEINKLAKVCEKLKNEGKSIVHCHGVFDLVHPGHIKHLQAAKKFGDILVVSLTEDKYVNKGPGRPIFNAKLRAENIASLEFVNYVTINHAPKAMPVIKAIKPDYYVKGQDYKNLNESISGGIIKEKNEVEKYGGKLVFTEEIQFSSSNLINQRLSQNDEKLNKYLRMMRNQISFNEIKKTFTEIMKYNVLVIGDVILDEYQFVTPLGKASKSATITAKMGEKELYAGGIIATANHIADFVKKVDLIADYGINSGIDYSTFIKKKLPKNVKWYPVFFPDRPTTLKRRFIEPTFDHKLFETIEIDDSPLNNKENAQLTNRIDELNNYDLVLIGDFGHGFLQSNILNKIKKKSSFIAINSQTNSANFGFNLLTKYNSCNYFSIDEREAQYAMHNKYIKPQRALKKLIECLNSQMGTITLGVNGSLVADKTNQHCITPSFTNNVLDTIGAGDAFFAISSLAAKAECSLKEVGFIGNAAGAIACQILGNKSYIKKNILLKYLKTLLA